MKEYIEKEFTQKSIETSKVVCDKCGAVVDLKDRIERYIQLEFSTENCPLLHQDEYPEYHLCNECARKFYKWFNYKWENDKNYKDNYSILSQIYDYYYDVVE